MSLIFYDTETTGTETFYDQILQFAAILTDADLNEIDRFEIRCRLLPHVVPAPGAMRVTGVTAAQLTDPNCPSHYDMVRAIRAKLHSWGASLYVGWNSMDFDEDLIRQALYKTLHNPYLTNRDGNNRTDAMRMIQACHLFAPDALIFPLNDKGVASFKLDVLAPANGFNHDKAHDALGDVEATIHMCRLLAEKAPDIWNTFMRFSTKAAVADHIMDEAIFSLSDFYFGKPFSWMVTTIGQHPEIDSEWYVYDLSIDPDSLSAMTDEQLTARLGRNPKPIRRLKSNAAPMIFAAEDAPGICKALEFGEAEIARRAALVAEGEALRDRLISTFIRMKEEYEPSPHIEKQIYDGFPDKPDELLMEAFHKADWPDRPAIVMQFQDDRLKRIGTHLIVIERPDLLHEDICREHHVASALRLMGEDDNVKWTTIPKALEEMEGFIAAATDAELAMLKDHHNYLLQLHADTLKVLNR